MKSYIKPEIEIVSLMQDESIAASGISQKEAEIGVTGILDGKGYWDEK